MKDVDLVVIAYDNRVAFTDGEVTTYYLDVRIHPDGRRAQGRSTLALVSKKDDHALSGYNNSAPYSADDFEALKEAAGGNVTALTDSGGYAVGSIYGVRADLLVDNRDLRMDTGTLAASECSVLPDAHGNEIRWRIFDAMSAMKKR
jgi:hypothetical protein